MDSVIVVKISCLSTFLWIICQFIQYVKTYRRNNTTPIWYHSERGRPTPPVHDNAVALPVRIGIARGYKNDKERIRSVTQPVQIADLGSNP